MCICEKQGDNLQVCRHNVENQLQFKFDIDDRCLIPHPEADPDYDQLNFWPARREVVGELVMLARISGPVVVMGLLLYLRGMISMQFLGYLGELELAGGSLSIGFANITGYSVISGLAMGMEPVCSQAFGAKRWSLLGYSLQRTILILLCASVPIGLLWVNIESILLRCGQDESITRMAGTYVLYSLPDLISQSFLHPLRIFLRTQSSTLPLTVSAGVALLLHIPINFLLVVYFKLSIRGVALAAVLTNFNIVIFLACYIWLSGHYKDSLPSLSTECLKGWASFLRLAIPSCASVCLEWWWYEFMILLCGLLLNPKATVASMGILIQTTALLYIFPSSLGVGVSTRVGNELGANRPAKARTATIVAIGSAAVLSFIAMSFTVTVRHVWGRMFTQDEQILSLVSSALPIVGLCELANWPQTTGCGVLRGSARPTMGANINLGSFYLFGTPVALILSFLYKFEFVGLWFGMLAAQGSCLILMLFVLLRTDWTVQAARAKELTAGSAESPLEKARIQIICSQGTEHCFYKRLYNPYEHTDTHPVITVVVA
ncbi:hypothetical protein SUGI_0301310 [Cryptomeria japonica]|uniref:protein DETOXIFICATION 48-like n=1 Tax=Cryptomeria japonica TaxID=3369 RepID=UPI002408D469|nr:protein DETOXIFICATION 48-like [Cryptomeria japonica]GLJ17346.1 hypothetical protein SUGI_0301310 [Cryptomeria japonica]